MAPLRSALVGLWLRGGSGDRVGVGVTGKGNVVMEGLVLSSGLKVQVRVRVGEGEGYASEQL